jgi:hypothetical protein
MTTQYIFLKCYKIQMGYKIYKQFPVQVFTKYSQIGIFGTQVGITSGSIEWLLTDHGEWGGDYQAACLAEISPGAKRSMVISPSLLSFPVGRRHCDLF